MHKKHLITVMTALAMGLPVSSTLAQSTPEKKALVARVLKAQKQGIEGMSREMVERPAVALVQAASEALQETVAAEKHEAIRQDIKADVRKYLDDAVPLVANRAIKLAPTTIGPFLEEKFTEAELKQIATFLESPAFSKYQRLSGDMQKVLQDKLLPEVRTTIGPKVTALEQSLAKRVGIVKPPAAAPK